MPEQYVGISNDLGYKLNIDAVGNLATVPGAPAGFTFYIQSMADIPGVAASNNFLSVFNPVGSGKILVFFQAIVGSYATGASSIAESFQIFRITAASGGSLVAASAVNRFLTAHPDPIAEVRVSNPAVTIVGNTLIAFPPPISIGAGEGSASSIGNPPGASFVCLPGEGLVFMTEAGDTDQVWDINTVWAETNV